MGVREREEWKGKVEEKSWEKAPEPVKVPEKVKTPHPYRKPQVSPVPV